MKYIIKNCPACRIYSAFGIDTETGCCYQFMGYCKNHSDCLLKQIAENLRKVAYACHCDNCDGCGYYKGCIDTECGTYQALKSLELLNIQEIEE